MTMTSKTLLGCTIGNLLEFYDFVIYALFSTVIATVFFANQHPQQALLNTFLIFAMGYLTRPLGGILFGHFSDSYSRRKTLAFTLMAMGIVTAMIGLLPGYAHIGFIAPVLLVMLRLCQGLTVAGESATSMVFLYEASPQHRRALSSILSLAGAVLGVLLALAVASIITSNVTTQQLQAWGWRLGFMLAFVLALIGVYCRLKLDDGQDFVRVQLPFKPLFTEHAKALLIGVLYLIFPAVYTAFTTIYLVPFLMTWHHYSLHQAMEMNVVVMLLLLLSLLFGAWLADRTQHYQRFSLLFFVSLFFVSVPLFYAMQSLALIISIAVFTILGGLAMGPEVVMLASLFKPSVRCSAIGFCHGITFSLITGFSPWLFALLQQTFSVVAVGCYVAVAALLSTLALLCIRC